MKVNEINEISKLSTPEKILLLEDLWDSISSADSEIPVPESHKEELDRRYKKHIHGQGELLTLEELQTCIDKRK
ncbi:MAG: addiction module protein [Candidatus Marinimicrobia bacterium]|nr:addiction module protein [Candidatus Neomarinimicrobiota bacterium]